jgi:hypothetical protein
MPSAFVNYFRYCEGLKFEARPDYEMLRQQFEQLFKDLGFQYDDEFDWTIVKRELIEKHAAEEEAQKKVVKLIKLNKRGK